ncbi:MAG: DUF3429 domain-containing protein [Rickettsiales bacterium]|nr:DUF3429 domain-containing protein [Rickettsiales bacterium]
MQNLSPRNVFIAQALTYAGTVPLVAGVLAAYFRVEHLDVLHWSRLYAAVIVSFISGIHWGVQLFHGEKSPRNLFITSNAIALLAWASLMFIEVKLALALQSLCFLYLLVLDYRLKEAKILPHWFYGLRNNATAIVVVCLMMLELA